MRLVTILFLKVIGFFAVVYIILAVSWSGQSSEDILYGIIMTCVCYLLYGLLFKDWLLKKL